MAEKKETKEKTKGKPKVLSCGCKHEYQDEKYGAGKRLCNATQTENKYRCTVCGTDKTG